ncbi:MAG: hypothetical protein DMD26_18785 [Gemmatimonadetes bacterium]|nr:MAG: hypothetical protein DMD26_18785 [Gemmatimonadota bacterium]
MTRSPVFRSALVVTTLLTAGCHVAQRAGGPVLGPGVSMRVPEPKLDVALDSLSEVGTVTSRSVSSQDVTEETIDVEARIQSLTAERDQLRALVQRASGLGDIFTIDRELARVQGEIDSLQHRLEHLRNSSALAELNAEFKKRREPGPVAAFFGAVGRGIGRLFVR